MRLRLIVAFVFVMALAAVAQAQVPAWKATFDVGPVWTLGGGNSVGAKDSEPLILKQGVAPSFGWNVGYVPDGGWGFQVRGLHFRTSAELHGNSKDVTIWNTNPRVQLFCSVMSTCTSDTTTHVLSESVQRDRLDFLAVRTFKGNLKRGSLFGGLAYVNKTRSLRQEGNWPDNIFNKPDGITTREVVNIRTEADTRFRRLGVGFGAEGEYCINVAYQLIVQGRVQLSFFPGEGHGKGEFVFDKTGTKSDGSKPQTPVHVARPFDGSLSGSSREANLEGSIGKYWGTTGLVFLANYIKATGEPDLLYDATGKAAIFGGWQTGNVSATYLRLAARFTFRF